MNEKLRIESPNELLELAIGYQKSQVLFTFVELEIPDILYKKSIKTKKLAEKLRIDSIALERFLNACIIAGLLERKNGVYKNTLLAESFLVKGNDFYLGGQMKRYKNRSYPLWENLTEKLKTWKYGSHAKSNPDEEDQGGEAMAEQHNLALLHGHQLTKAFDFSKFSQVLDLGGGTGAMSIALCKAYPNLKAIVFDLPENIKTAEKFIEKSKLSKRVETLGGDVKQDELPENFDIVLLANFMAVADAEANQKLLARIYKRLPPKGVCLLSGWIIDDTHLAPQASVLFCLEDICWNAPDVERDEKVYTSWLAKAGFEKIKCRTYLEPTKMLYGIKN